MQSIEIISKNYWLYNKWWCGGLKLLDCILSIRYN